LTFGGSTFDRVSMTSSNRRNFTSLSSRVKPSDFHALKKELEGRYAEFMDFYLFSMSPEVQEIFGTNKDFSLLLRPDNHVGFISSDISSGRVQDYLTRFIGRSEGNGSPGRQGATGRSGIPALARQFQRARQLAWTETPLLILLRKARSLGV